MTPARLAMLKGAATALLLAVSLGAAYRSHNRLSFYKQQIATRLQERETLEKIEERLANQRAAFDWIAAQADGQDTVANVMKRHLSGAKSDLILREKRPAGRNWTVQVMDLRIEPVTAEKLSAFLVACENARPPIRLLDIQVSASPDARSLLVAQLALAELNAPALLSNP